MFTRLREAFATFDKWFTRFWLAVGVLLVVAANLVVVRVWFCQIRATTYPTTEGVVLSHKQVEHEKYTEVVIEYEYEVNGVRWVSHRPWYTGLGEFFPTVSSSDRAVANTFPPGARVPVSYDPANSSDAVLIPGIWAADVISVWMILLFNAYVISSARYTPDPNATEYSVQRWLPKRFGWRYLVTDRTNWPGSWAWLLMVSAICSAALSASPSLPSAMSGLGTIAVSVAAAWLLARLLRPRARLDADVERRELRWRSGELFHGTFRLPFETVTNIRAEEWTFAERTTYRVEIDWYSSLHRTRTLVLASCPDRIGVEIAVARLRELVFGAAGPPQLVTPAAS